MATRSRARSLTPAQQAVALRAVFPSAEVLVRPTGLVWVGLITPTPLARTYTVRLSYTVGKYPRVVVVDPALEPSEKGVLPHFYREGSLCLHEAHQWDRDMLIVDTIIPWAAEWLAYYELWKRTGQWYGDGNDEGVGSTTTPFPSVGDRPKNRAERRREQREEARRMPRQSTATTGKREPDLEIGDQGRVHGHRPTARGVGVRDVLSTSRP
jgi:hypothetical protein